MASSAILLGAAGVVLTFVPDELVRYMRWAPMESLLFVVQLLGALYFAFGMLNWMAKGSLIGGIYNRPIAIANLSHFLIAGLALAKGLIAHPDLPLSVCLIGIVYIVFTVLFGIILFRHPLSQPSQHDSKTNKPVEYHQ
ncbi:hypothetical protein GCM10007389_03990 [Pontibacter akesuensis]|nr:hypothetical protein GCM10007389_03990 [Pontibacter akesuensis]